MGCGGSTTAREESSPRESSFKPFQSPASPSVSDRAPAPATTAVSDSPKLFSVFSEVEATNLRRRFMSLARVDKDDGLIDQKEFLTILKFEDSLFTDRVFKMFDTDQNGTITLEEFMDAVAVLSKNGPVSEKIRLSFRMWDLNSDGCIAKSELYELMKSSLEASHLLVSEDQMNKLIDATFALADCDSNGSISPAEYEKLVHMFPSMISNMTLDIAAKLEVKPAT